MSAWVMRDKLQSMYRDLERQLEHIYLPIRHRAVEISKIESEMSELRMLLRAYDQYEQKDK